MANRICVLYDFLNAAKGNWRNSVFIECFECPHGRPEPCPGFLLAPDSEGRPVLIPSDAIFRMSGIAADKSECQSVLSRQHFESLFSLWLDWQTDSSSRCSLLQLTEKNQCVCGQCVLNP